MRVEIRVYDDKNEIVAEQIGNAINPQQWKSHPEKPLIDGDYQMFAFTYQPTVVLKGKAGGY